MNTDEVHPLTHAEPRSMAPPLPFAGFGPLFFWGIRTTFAGKRFFVVAIAAIVIGVLVGLLAVPRGVFVTDDTRYFRLWELLDVTALKFLIPLTALLFVSAGFSREIRDRTLVYHLVRPVSRSTMYVARFVSGLVPAAIVAVAMLISVCLTQDIKIPSSVWTVIPLVAVLGVTMWGAMFYLLGTLFRHGMIAGLVYTFVVEMLLAEARGALANASITFHLRSLVRGQINDEMSTLSTSVADALDPNVGTRTPEEQVRDLLSSMGEIVYESPTTAIIVAVGVTAVLVSIGAWLIRRRDYALKD